VSAFFFSKVLTDLIPMRIIPAFVFCSIVYFMIGKSLQSTIINNSLSYNLQLSIIYVL